MVELLGISHSDIERLHEGHVWGGCCPYRIRGGWLYLFPFPNFEDLGALIRKGHGSLQIPLKFCIAKAVSSMYEWLRLIRCSS